jgi:hypothetical protein
VPPLIGGIRHGGEFAGAGSTTSTTEAKTVMWITALAISKWHRPSTFATERSIMTKESNVVGLTDGSPGFTHAKYYRSLRSETPLHRLGPP